MGKIVVLTCRSNGGGLGLGGMLRGRGTLCMTLDKRRKRWRRGGGRLEVWRGERG